VTAAPSPRARAWAEAVLGGSAPTTEAASSGRRGGVALSVAPAAPAPPPPPAPVAAELDAEGARVRAAIEAANAAYFDSWAEGPPKLEIQKRSADSIEPGDRVFLTHDLTIALPLTSPFSRHSAWTLDARTELLVLSVDGSRLFVEFGGISLYVGRDEVTP